MNTVSIMDFNLAYKSYYDRLIAHVMKGDSVLEVGGGSSPSLENMEGIKLTVVDPVISTDDTSKNYKVVSSSVEHWVTRDQFNLVCSKMVLEHIEDPTSFHKRIFALLKPGGKAIHFFACRNSLPSLVNRMLPESMGRKILTALKNRNLDAEPKFKAYYKKTKPFSSELKQFYENLGYEIVGYDSFLGHKYFREYLILGALEKLYSKLILKFKLSGLATVALLELQKPINTN